MMIRCCAASSFLAASPEWVKTRMPPERSDVSFRQLRTSRPMGSILPCASGCEQSQQVAPYSINLSARSRNASERVRPIALAVLRLMMSSYLDACSTGSSAGLTPLRILSM
jgi:hypothetical protein